MNRWYRRTGKRILDLSGAALLLAIMGPLLLGIGALVRWRLGSPVLFRQVRTGFNGQSFKLLKFRTMEDLYDSHGRLLPDEFRLTAFGRFLRATGLDELPELWNILRGEMSFVGPRPLLEKYFPLYSMRQLRRHEALPGITGLAQVSGRNRLSWEERFECDVQYVEELSFGLDLRILARTLGAVLRPAEASAEGHATMPEFEGDSKSRQTGVAA